MSRETSFDGTAPPPILKIERRRKTRYGEAKRSFDRSWIWHPQNVVVLAPDRDRTRLYANQTALDYLGFTLEEWQNTDRHEFIHPDDWERVSRETQDKFLSGLPHECEARVRGKDGKYRWFLLCLNPVRDEQGRVTRWYSATTDIDDRKQAEQRLQNENIALREEVDQASMFEEIVGPSAALRRVLSQVAKVAPTDSTVLILGETGPGEGTLLVPKEFGRDQGLWNRRTINSDECTH